MKQEPVPVVPLSRCSPVFPSGTCPGVPLKFLYDEFEQKRDRLSKEESLEDIMEQTLNNSAAASDVK